MASFKLVSLLILVSFANFAIAKTEDLHFLGSGCSNIQTTPNSLFHSNLRTLFKYLSSNATTGNKEFYNTTVHGKNQFDTVYGLFMCRGDIPSQLCGQCVSNATQQYLSNTGDCSLAKEGMLKYDECMVRYSNHSFFSIVNLESSISTSASCQINNNDPASFMHLWLETMNKTANEAASSPILVKKYATNQARISGFQSFYSLAQCTPDLSPQDCRSCLNVMTTNLTKFQKKCIGNEGTAYSDTCYIKYASYPFYRPSRSPAPTGLIPATNLSNKDSKYSGDPGYISHNCTSNEVGTTASNSSFASNLRSLLSSLSSKATSKTGFYKTAVVDGKNPSDTVNGLFMCRGDISASLCQLCVENATKRISSECSSSNEAIIWYNHCLLRYSHRPFLTTGDETSPTFHEFNITNTSSNLDQQRSFFTWTLANALSDAKMATGESTTKNYGTAIAKLNDLQTLYALGQCTPDLDNGDCLDCLDNIFLNEIPWCCLASPEGKVFYPSCYMMFGLSKFYGDGDEVEAISQPSPPSGTTEKKKDRSRVVILIAVPAVVAAMLLCFGWHLLRRKERRSYKSVVRENFGDESAALEPLQFDLVIIEAATNSFSPENKIGKGGFGEVYKGILSDGRHIAVKRLSKSSKQGIIEFKNEVLLIAKFQHRNLVTFIGFCLKDQEKILIYEYVPNGSLDHFLFENQHQKWLNWPQRYKIIKGIARGIHYLHEHSRPKIIHRDLKPSNVLLDESMNPKLSDFGIARIVEIDRDQEVTNRIVGTFGYMSPEYAMLGCFSDKSDVFSFGVIILEIITGKKNLSSYEPHCIASGLLSYVWKKWREQIQLSILDHKIKENYSEIEVMKCIHIGLLCVQENPDVRPSMMMIISYLDNCSIELPSPQEPAFFLHRKMDHQNIVAEESSVGHIFNNFTLSSVNEMSISDSLSR